MALHWQAVYADGQTFDGPYHGIDRSRLAEFRLLDSGGAAVFACAVLGDELVYRKRTTINQRGADVWRAIWHMVSIAHKLIVFVNDETLETVRLDAYGDEPFSAPAHHPGEPCLTT